MKSGSKYPLVLVSVLNWNAADKTIRCLDSLQKCQYPHKEIVVVDNHSGDDSIAQIKRSHPSVKIITTPENLGYAGGHAYSVNYAKSSGADLLWILNNDLTVFEDTLQELIIAFVLSGEECMLGSVSFSDLDKIPEMPVWTLGPAEEVLFDASVNLAANYETGGVCRDKKPLQVANLYGNSMLVPVSIIGKYGFIDCSFFMYAEENDYCFRLRQSGVKLYLIPASKVLHENGGTAKMHSAIKAAMRYYITRNTLIFYKRHRPDTYKSSIKFLSTYYALLPVRRFILGRNQQPFDLYEFCGFVDAILGRMGKRIKPEKYLH
jgi:GT2 family glycosyltransferase